MKGIRDQIDNDKPYEILTEEELIKHVKELLVAEPEGDEGIVLGQYCRTNGFIMRSALDLNTCNDLKCASCQEFIKALEDGKGSD